MANEQIIDQMVDEIKSLEDEVENYCDDIQPKNLEYYGKTEDEKFQKFMFKEEYRKTQIKEVIQELANKFDINHPKTYSQVKEIVTLKLFQKELYGTKITVDYEETSKYGVPLRAWAQDIARFM